MHTYRLFIKDKKTLMFYEMVNYIVRSSIPGHSLSLHVLSTTVLPAHGVPPNFDSCSICRTPLWVPPPHVWLQGPQNTGDQRQSTEHKNQNRVFCPWFCLDKSFPFAFAFVLLSVSDLPGVGVHSPQCTMQ